MKLSALKYTVLSWTSGLTMVILLLMPFHAFLTVWGSTLVGHYTALRLWKEALLMLCIVGVMYLIATDHKIRSHTMSRRLVWLILAYMLLNIVWGFLAYNEHQITAKALGYGLIVNLRFLAFFLVTWAIALRLGRLRSNWQRLLYGPAAIVVAFAIIQVLFLTPRFLEHFGYSMYTILPFQYVNNNSSFLRAQSTLRGANPLGAYLIIPITAMTVLLLSKARQWKHVVFYVASLLALFFTFSRGAWIGLVLSVLAVLCVQRRSFIIRHIYWIATVALILVVCMGVGLRQNSQLENVVLHTETGSNVPITSNEAHASALRSGLHDLKHDPLGSGPGTAGPASVYNNKPRIAENYFIQIGQETGWLGLAMFLLINAGVCYLLWLRRSDPLALGLFASLIGLTFINLLSHAWADDTLAYVWWGLAGIAMVSATKIRKDA
ncbi:MAG: O-antigen ligase family protein [Patescibacteria group bacterium]